MDFPDPRIEPVSPALQADSLLSDPLWKSMEHMNADFTLAVVAESNCVTTSNSASLDDFM